MTLEERERRAYANGQIEEAKILAMAIDLETERIHDLDYEVRSLGEHLKEVLERCSCND